MTDVERLARAMCIAGGGDPDRLLDGAIRNVAGELEWDEEISGVHTTIPQWRYRYKFWRVFQTQARAVINEIWRQPLRPVQAGVE